MSRSLVCLVLLASASVVRAEPLPETLVDVGQGTLYARSRDGGEPRRFPLARTEVDAQVSGPLVGVHVTQVFENPYDEVLEAVYVFPLPEEAAVDDFELQVKDRVVKGVLERRAQALEHYEQAKREGKAAALLDQERPNVFTTSVANILPHERIAVRLHYVEQLRYDHGTYEFNFPMTVGPRYVPGTPLASSGGAGLSPDTTRVPDASRITPPPLLNTRLGADVALTLRVDAGLPLESLSSPSHDVKVLRPTPESAVVTLAPHDTIPNKTFTCRFTTAGKSIRSGVLATRTAGGPGHFLLVLQPQLSPDLRTEVTPKEMVFVLDTSGSMWGRPIEAAKAVMREAVRSMNPEDTFQIFGFDNATSSLSPTPLTNTPANVARGVAFVDGFTGGGGTHMNAGIHAALGMPRDPQRMRIVFFMTDGFIGNDSEVLGQIQREVGDTRLYPFGVGSDVNRHLISGMAELGRGEAEFVRLADEPTEIARRFYDHIRAPLLTDVSVDFGSLRVKDVLPARIPDLFEAQPLVLVGRYEHGGRGRVTVHGRIRGHDHVWNLDVVLPDDDASHADVAKLWGRRHLHELTVATYAQGETAPLVEELTATALEYGLMSKYTSFVAVENVVRVNPGDPTRTELVPVPLPEGVSPDRIFGSLSREAIPPGDPIITVRAPATAKRVTATFPFGLVKELSWDAVTWTWRGRFLVPKNVKDGVYRVGVVVETRDGNRSTFDVPYRLDATGPDLVVELPRSLARGEPFSVTVDTIEAAKEVTVYAEVLGEEQFALTSGPAHLRFTGRFTLPADVPLGSCEFVFVARDLAGNRTEQRLPVVVTE